MLLLFAMMLSFLFLFIPGGWGTLLTVSSLVALIAIAISTYYRGMDVYWGFRRIQKQFDVLRAKRYTILEKIIASVDDWGGYEGDILSNASQSSDGVAFLMERYPFIQTMGLVNRYLLDLKEIESAINYMLSERVSIASKWFQLRENIFINVFVPGYKDVPRDLLGSVYDPELPGDGAERW